MTAPVYGPQLPEDTRQFVAGFDGEGAAIFAQVGIEDISFKGRFGALAGSNTSATAAVGNFYFTIDVDDGTFKVGDDVLIVSKDDQDVYMWGEVIDKDTVEEPARLRINVDDVSPVTMTSSNWEIQVVARPKPGIEKDTSSTSVAFAAVGSTMTFTVQSGKFFPIGGKLLLKALATPTAVAIGKVLAYNGTSLVVQVVAKTSAASGTFTSWSLALLDAPQDRIPLFGIHGLKVKQNASNWNYVDISAGSVRDSTDTVDLVLSSNLTKKLNAAFVAGTNQGAYTQTANLAGTVSNAAGTLTGVGTAFLTDFLGTLTDYASQFLAWTGSAFAGVSSIITANTSALTFSISAITNTVGSDAAANFASQTYKRGGYSGAATYGIVVTRKDVDGTIDVCATAFTNGEPDLPSGYTYYRVIARVDTDSANSILTIYQPLHGVNSPSLLEIGIAPSDKQNWAILSGFSNSLSAVLSDIDFNVSSLSGSVSSHETRIVDLEGDADESTYSPATASNVNLDANPTVGTFEWGRNANRIIVSGNMAMNPTAAAGTTTSCNLSLPIARVNNFSSAGQAHGLVIGVTTNAEVGHVESVSGTKNVKVEFNAQTTANHQVYIMFTYIDDNR